MPQHWGPSWWSSVQGAQLRFRMSSFKWIAMSRMGGNTVAVLCVSPAPVPSCRPGAGNSAS